MKEDEGKDENQITPKRRRNFTQKKSNDDDDDESDDDDWFYRGKGKGGEGKRREEDHAERMVRAVSTLLFAISRALRALEMRRP